MRASVLPDATLAKHAGRFVWLSLDTEKTRNAPFLERFPVEVWPTFLVIDPDGELVLARWLGGATVEQLDRLLASVERRTPSRSVEAAVASQQATHDLEACATTAERDGPALRRGSAFAQVAATGLSCALDAPSESPWRAGSIAALEPLALEALRLPQLLADDRAALYDVLVQARHDRGDRDGAHVLAERWWRFLEREGRRATSAEQRAALDSWRVAAADALDDPARALPALAASERDLPDDYNPPARRAYVLRQLGRLGEARAAAERALAKAYGPRKLRIHELAASILERQGDRDALAKEVDAALAYAKQLPPAQQDEKVIAKLRARRGEVEVQR